MIDMNTCMVISMTELITIKVTVDEITTNLRIRAQWQAFLSSVLKKSLLKLGRTQLTISKKTYLDSVFCSIFFATFVKGGGTLLYVHD